MFEWRNACSVGLAAIVLAACTPAVREWWTEDLRDRRSMVVWNQPAPYSVPLDTADRRDVEVASVPAPKPSGVEPRVTARDKPPASPSVSPRPPDAERRRREVSPSPKFAASQAPIGAGPAARSPARVAPVSPPTLPPPPAAETASRVIPAPADVVPDVAASPIVPASVTSLAGLAEGDVRRLLGAPRSQTDKGSQKIWTYAGEGCSVEVIFFLDVTRGTYAALDHKTLDADGRTPSEASCLQSHAPLAGRTQ
jgi:hypothetical protein